MRLAFITVGDTSRRTGGYLYNARLISGLREHGVEVEEITPCGATLEEQEEAAPRFGADLDPARFDALVVDALARAVCAPHLDRWRRERPVVALVHELPSVAGTSGDTDLERAREAPLLRSDRLVAVSGHGRSVLEGRGVPPERVHVVPPGLDRLQPEARREPGDGTLHALCVAQWIPCKGILTLVEAWSVRERPGATLELVGETDADPEYAASVREAVATSGGAISVRGPVDDAALAAAYATADLFVLPSRHEGYGIAYTEALANGLPVIACRVGPVPELVREEAALLVPPDDAAPLSNALDRLLEDADLRERMSAAARRRAEELPRWEDTVRGLHDTLLEAIEERASL